MCVSIPYSLTIPYYSAIKKNEIVPFAAMWMELEIVILSEVSQMEKVKYHIIYTKNLKKKWYKEILFLKSNLSVFYEMITF